MKMVRAGVVLMGLMLSPAIRAEEPAPVHPQLQEDWRKVYFKGRQTARKGLIVGGIGGGVMGLGVASMVKQAKEAESSDHPLAGMGNMMQLIGAGIFIVLPGFITMYVGGGMAAGGSARAHRAVKKMGYTKKIPYWSHTSWTLLGGPWVTNPFLSVLTVPTSFATSGLQLRQDRKFYEAGVHSQNPQGGVYLQLAPVIVDDAPGLGIRAIF